MRSIKSTLALASFLFSGSGIAGVHFTGSGYWSKDHLSLETRQTQMVKGAVSVDLGPYLRLGYSYSELVQKDTGHRNDGTSSRPIYTYFEKTVNQYTHSLDLFAILYNGRVFTPYIFGGMGLKNYNVTYIDENDYQQKLSVGPLPFPNYGCGLSIQMSQNFSLKLSNTWSIGVKQDLDGKEKNVRDSQLDVGISYAIR